MSSSSSDLVPPTCPECKRVVKLDAGKTLELDHRCSPATCGANPRKRLRGPPSYAYGSGKAGGVSRRRKVAGDNKKLTDPNREKWLEEEVLHRKYDSKEVWCRYCGAFQTSGWARGPWGTNKLCQTHYAAWFKKKILDLSAYPTEPKEPINRYENSEFDHLARETTRKKREADRDAKGF